MKKVYLVVRVDQSNHHWVISAHSSRRKARKKAKELGGTPETSCHFSTEHTVETYNVV